MEFLTTKSEQQTPDEIWSRVQAPMSDGLSLKDKRRLVRYTFTTVSYSYKSFNERFLEMIALLPKPNGYFLYYTFEGSPNDGMPQPTALVSTKEPLEISEWKRIEEQLQKDAFYRTSVQREYSDRVDAEMDKLKEWKAKVPQTDWIYRHGKIAHDGDVEDVRKMLVSE